MNFKEYKNLDYAQVGDEILQFWKDNHIFEKSIEVRDGAPAFTFYEGPPSANGMPGIHHVMARTIKDIFCRYKTLRGFQVNRKGGWDTHGLPIELQVEKELGITKDDIGKKISVEDYNQKCREAVMRFTDLWQSMTDKMGYWVDMNDPYITYKNEYIESIWHLLKQLYDKDLLYKGYTIQPYSPAAGTGLSSHELNMPGTYKDVKDTTIVAMFKSPQTPNRGFNAEGPVYFLAWTTTPWTLPANSALTVGANIDYVLVKTFNPYTHEPANVILAKALVSKYFSEKGQDADFEGYAASDKKILPWAVLAEMKGKDLVGAKYEPLIPAIEVSGKAFEVIAGDFVTTEDGTGIVHTSPTFGADDYRVAKQNGISSVMVLDENKKEVPIVNRQGRFVDEMGEWLVEKVEEFGIKTHKKLSKSDFYVKNYTNEDEKAENYKTTDEIIAIVLKSQGLAFKVERYEHTYPHCWRTDKPVLYYPLDSWFIATTKKKDRLVELNKTINWQPESTGTGRFGNWLENLVDWNLSRSRYWGTPLPIWRTEDGTEEVCIGSIGELSREVDKAIAAGLMDSNPFLPQPNPSASAGRPQEKGYIENPVKTPLPKWEDFVYTTNPEGWSILKSFARENRKNQTEAESILWDNIRNRKLADSKFRRQHAIGNYIADFVCIEKNIVIEIDGEYHQFQKDLDAIRTKYLNEWGFNVIRFTNTDVLEHLDTVLVTITNELKSAYPKNSPSPMERGQGGEVNFDLHRPYVDRIVLISESGKPMTRETDLIDVWFDSGAMPYAQWHYMGNDPKNNVPFPANFISEGVDQTRGWFFTLHAIAGMLFDSVAFENVVSTGLVLDKNGNKMSKRLGNGIDPFETLAKFGPDATRWYMITNAEPWDNLRFNLDGIPDVQRKFFGTLFNTYNFFALYANLDNYKVEQFDRIPLEKLTELDRWIVSKVFTLVKEVGEQYDNYNPTKAGRLVQDFVCDDLSNWYVRLNRRRFWKGEMTEDKRAAYQTLQHCLCAVAQLMSPIAPFFGDWLYKNLTDSVREESIAKNTPFKHESVHFTDWHTYEPYFVNKDLEDSMTLAQNICSLVHSLRKGNKLKVRQPLQKVLIPVLNATIRQQIEHVAPIIMSEVNVKAVEFVSDDSGILKKKIKPNFKVLGPKYGKDMKLVAEFVNQMTGEQINELEKAGELLTNSAVPSFSHLKKEDVEISAEDVPGWLVASENGLTVALDVTVTEELRKEGIARDFVNRVQNLRKDQNFEVTDKINIQLENNNPELVEAVVSQKDYICEEVQAISLEIIENLADATEIEMDEFLLRLVVKTV